MNKMKTYMSRMKKERLVGIKEQRLKPSKVLEGRIPLAEATNRAKKPKIEKQVKKKKETDEKPSAEHHLESEKLSEAQTINETSQKLRIQDLLSDIDSIVIQENSFANQTLNVKEPVDFSIDKYLLQLSQQQDKLELPSPPCPLPVVLEELEPSTAADLQVSMEHEQKLQQRKKRRKYKRICMPRYKRKQKGQMRKGMELGKPARMETTSKPIEFKESKAINCRFLEKNGNIWCKALKDKLLQK
jgi:hypothetical protein